MNYKKILTISSAALLSLGLLGLANNQTASAKKTQVQETNSYNLMTKVAGNKNYAIWKTVRNGKPKYKVADGINFRYNHIQSNQSIKTKKYTYWLIYVDGRRVGWVNEHYFARNKISVAKNVSLVNNRDYDFNVKDSISYVTDKTGSIVDNSEVKVSEDSVNCAEPKTVNIKYTLGSAEANSKVTVRKTTSEGIADANTVKTQPGTRSFPSWKYHYGASINYLSPKLFIPEKKRHTWTSGDLTLKTRLYQPVYLSVKTDTMKDGNINRVGHIPEGLTVSNGWAYTSLLSHTNLLSGHIVGYNLNKLVNPYNPQHLLTMSQKKFNTYVKNIKVSPYIPIGHGQAMGSTDKHVYVLANDNKKLGTSASEELFQIKKSDLTINKVWTIKCWDGTKEAPRYFKNAVVVNDHLMYALFYDHTQQRYEYWRFDRTGDNWNPEIVGATKDAFVGNGEPVQGFTYDPINDNFYIVYNDLVVKLTTDGKIVDHYTFKTGRESEGISVSDNKLWINLAQRAELLESNKLN